jgi:hypothetical protein
MTIAGDELAAVERELRHVHQQQVNDLKKQKMQLVGRIGGLKREMKLEATNKNNVVLLVTEIFRFVFCSLTDSIFCVLCFSPKIRPKQKLVMSLN